MSVDVEQVRDTPDVLSIAEQLFAPAEADALRSMLPEARRDAFFRYWTRKEAVIKATARVCAGPSTASIQLTPLCSGLKQLDGRPALYCGWSLTDLQAPLGHVASGSVASAPSEPPPDWRALEPVWNKSPKDIHRANAAVDGASHYAKVRRNSGAGRLRTPARTSGDGSAV